MTFRLKTSLGTVDNRQAEYEQAIVKLGIEKADLEREAEILRKEVYELSEKKNKLIIDITNLTEGITR